MEEAKTITREELIELVHQAHNPSLVKPDAQPGANTIYHFYHDGEITFTKGGWAYLKRSEFTQSYPLHYSKHLKPKSMPLKLTIDDYGIKKRIGYAIVSYEDAIKLVNLMKNVSDA